MLYRTEDGDSGSALSAFLREKLVCPWSQCRRLIETGKVFLDGERVLNPGHRLAAGQSVEVRERAPKPRDATREVRIVHDDAHVVVLEKPPGISSVPFEKRERGTAMDLVRDAWKRRGGPSTRQPLLVVHRIDRDTSGLLMFAKTKLAERALGSQFREHSIGRHYLCVAHGPVRAGRIETHLVRDRGDGLRGSAKRPGQGKRAVTHVDVIERLRGASLCRVTLETGRTHQIRIHLSERGWPLVGERVYIRDYLRDEREPIPAKRLLLHAASLSFDHPTSGERLSFSSEPPESFSAAVDRLRRQT